MIACSVITAVLGCFVTLFLYFRYIYFLGLPVELNILSGALFVLMGCAPLFAEYYFEKYLGRFYPAWRHGVFFVFIACVLLFTFSLLADVFYFSGIGLGWIRPFSHGVYSAVLIALSLGCATYALYAGLKVPALKEVTLYSDKITRSYKFVLLSDIHIHRAISADKVKKIVAAANAQQADAVLLIGDVIDDELPRVKEVVQALEALKADKGVYFVTGNHEYYVGYQDSVAELKRLGFTLLENSGVSLGEVYVAGIPDETALKGRQKEEDLLAAFASSASYQYKILMSHSPVDFKEKNNFDIEVSGHTHGGQIFPFIVLTKLHNKYLSGLYKMSNNAHIYVSNGAGQWGPQMRFLAPAEITVMHLEPKNG